MRRRRRRRSTYIVRGLRDCCCFAVYHLFVMLVCVSPVIGHDTSFLRYKPEQLSYYGRRILCRCHASLPPIIIIIDVDSTRCHPLTQRYALLLAGRVVGPHLWRTDQELPAAGRTAQRGLLAAVQYTSRK